MGRRGAPLGLAGSRGGSSSGRCRNAAVGPIGSCRGGRWALRLGVGTLVGFGCLPRKLRVRRGLSGECPTPAGTRGAGGARRAGGAVFRGVVGDHRLRDGRAQISAHAGEQRRSAGGTPGSGRIGAAQMAQEWHRRSFRLMQLKISLSGAVRRNIDLRPNGTAEPAISPHRMRVTRSNCLVSRATTPFRAGRPHDQVPSRARRGITAAGRAAPRPREFASMAQRCAPRHARSAASVHAPPAGAGPLGPDHCNHSGQNCRPLWTASVARGTVGM